jgi:hypothetical protein
MAINIPENQWESFRREFSLKGSRLYSIELVRRRTGMLMAT